MARRGNQNRIITFRLTPGRHKMLQRWADEARLDVSEFVRRLLEVEEARRTASQATEQAA
jgi:uncharacterized protein (DUF1778 family)